MTKESNFKLDTRIKSINDIQTIICNNHDFIGCKGFFFDDFVKTKVLRKCDYGTLVDINVVGDDDHCFKARDENGNDFVGYYRFFIPEDALNPEEKKYRPFSVKEFIEKFEFKLGFVIRLREKSEYGLSRYEYKTVFIGYRTCGEDIEVFLNGTWYTMHTLFENYEYMENDEWKPFGVLVEE